MPQPRELADDYRLEKIIGSSRGASLLRGTQLRTGRGVVIKLINVPAAAGAAALAARFVEHAPELARLRHPNLPVVLDWGLTPEGGAFLVMEPLDGVGFDSHPRGAGAAPDRVLPLLMQAVAGLAELAGHGLAHLNLCPENLLLVLEATEQPAEVPLPPLPSSPPSLAPPRRLTVKLLGLGTGLFRLGQPWPEAACARFRAPELAAPGAPRAPLDWRADCYALALTACNALGATVAFGEASGAIVQMPLALSFELANDEALRRILERSMRQAPAERPEYAEIRDAFSMALGGSGGARETASLGTEAWSGDTRTGGGFGESGSARTAGHAEDSLLDFFDVPAVLPEIEEDPAGSRAGFGLHVPDGFEATVEPVRTVEGGDSQGLAGEEAGGNYEKLMAGERFQETGDLAGWEAPPLAAFGLDEPAEAPTAPRSLETAGAAPSPAAAKPRGAASGPGAGTNASAPDQAPAPATGTASGGMAAASTPPGAGAGTGAGSPPPGEMLSAVDDLLGALPPPPAPVSAAPPGAAAAGARGTGGKSGGTAAAAGGTPSGGGALPVAPGRLHAFLAGLPQPVRLAGGGALLLLLAVAAAVFALLGHGSRQASSRVDAAGMDSQGAPPARPGRSAAAKFLDAKSYLISGRDSDERVRQALRELTFADQGQLGDEGCIQLSAIQRTLAIAALETMQQDLANGLRNGDLAALQNVVEVAAERDLPPSQKGDFERATRLVSLYRQAQAAAAGGDQALVLVHFQAMDGLARALRDPLELRDKAARALEADAAALARDGKYAQAESRLQPILASWPARSGIKELVKSYRVAAANETSQLALLDSLPGYERRRKPSAALDLLRPLTPTPHLASRIAEARQRLEEQLAQLDAQPPEVRLRDGYVLDYSRGTMVTLSFRVTDDYQVETVKLYAKPETGRLRELPLQRQGLNYTAEIPASIHQNGTVEFYVVATDLSGHQGTLGSKEKPLRLKRRQGFERLIR
jgi:hypothetical protein